MMDKESYSVLVVDPHPETSVLFKKSLHSKSVFPADVDSASTVHEAMEKVKLQAYDLLLMEVDFYQGSEATPLMECVEALDFPIPLILMTPVRDDRLFRAAKRMGIGNMLVMSESHFDDLALKIRTIYEGKQDKKEESPDNTFFEERQAGYGDIPKPEPLVKPGPMVDELTGIYTHSYFQQRVVEEFSRATRYNYPVSCIFIDIDHFKVINEDKGYHVGDLLLRECANFLFDHCRVTDIIARYSGAEFAVLMPYSSYEEAMEAARRMRLKFAAHDFKCGEEVVNFSISLGVTSYPEDAMARRGDLISFARHALLRSKANGRNRVTQYRHSASPVDTEAPVPQLDESGTLEFQRKLSEVAEMAKRGALEAARALIHALEKKDKHTAGHGAACAKYSRYVAEALGMSVEDCDSVEQGALLHDIGKICISDEILLKPAKLTFEEYEKIKEHAYLGYKLLKPIRFLREEGSYVLHHHEWFNGEGYPSRLKGDAIPLGARIIATVDGFDTIRNAGLRYKKTYPTLEAVQELIRYSGTQFDPRVVKVFIDVLKVRHELNGDEYDLELLQKKLSELPNPEAPLYVPRED